MTSPGSVRLSGCARTLLYPLRARAEEHRRPDRLFADPVAERWHAAMPPWSDSTGHDAVSQLAHAVRTATIDDIVRARLRGETRSVVVELGAGLSTRHYRLAGQGACWIHVDLEAVVALHLALEADAAGVVVLPACVPEHWEWLAAVDGVDRPCIVAEGLLPYLAKDDVRALFAGLRERFPGASIVFDVVGPAFPEGARQNLIRMGAPLRWTVEQDVAEIMALGVSVQSVSVPTDRCPARWAELGHRAAGAHDRARGFLVSGRLLPLGARG